MQPTKDKSLHYFVIEDEGFSQTFHSYSERTSMYGDDRSFSTVVHLLELFKKEDYDDLFIKLGPREHRNRYYKWIDTSCGNAEFKQGFMQGDYAVKLPIKIKYVEKVKKLQPYAGSVDFTIGTSKRRGENDLVLVGVDIDWSSADEQTEKFNKLNKGLEMKLEELFIVDAVFQKVNYSPIGSLANYSHGGFCLEIPILGKGALSGMDVNNYTYDELYKYYTLL